MKLILKNFTFKRIEIYIMKIKKFQRISMNQWSEKENILNFEIIFQNDFNEWLYDLRDFNDVEKELN